MSNIIKTCFLLVTLMLHYSCYAPHSAREVSFPTINNNACKTLRGQVVVYAIFVDSKHTRPWSEHDITTTLDSIQLAMDWIEMQATNDSISLDIKVDYHQTTKGNIPIYKDFSRKTLSATLYKLPLWSGIKEIYRWADKIAFEAAKSLPKDTSAMVTTRNTLKDRERLIARLRDIYKTDKVALIYFINNYHTDEISVAFDIGMDNNVEFAIVSFKRPAVIAHEFLHLFGAEDLYIGPFDRKKKIQKKKEKLTELFPNEVMAYAHRNINSLEISAFTKYLIGWDKQLDEPYEKLFLGKKFFATRY